MVKAALQVEKQVYGFEEASVTTVSLSEVFAAGLRLEASAYGAEARTAVDKVKAYAGGHNPLFGGAQSLVTEATNAFRFKRTYVSKDIGTRFFSSSDIIDIDADTDKYLSKTVTRNLSSLSIDRGDVLISCSGTIGNIGFAGRRLKDAACSQHVIRAKAADLEKAGFVAAFLRTEYGRLQLTSSVYGSVVQHIEPSHLANVVTPNLHPIKQIEIGRKFVNALDCRDLALDSLDKARKLLGDATGLSRTSSQVGVGTSVVSLSQLRDRFDAGFHAAEVLELEEKIRRDSNRFRPLDSQIHRLQVNGVTKFRKRVYVPRGGIPLLSSKQIFQIDPIDVKQLGRAFHSKDMAEIGLHHREVCVTRSGTVGRVFIVPSYMAGWAASEHILKIVGMRPEIQSLIYTWLSSDHGQLLLQRLAFGSVIREIDRWQLCSLPVPVVADDVLAEIHDCIEFADEQRSAAWHFEQSAIKDIEDALG